MMDEGGKCEKQLWKDPGHPRRRQEVVPSALGQDSLAARRGGQPEQVDMTVYLHSLKAKKKRSPPLKRKYYQFGGTLVVLK